MILRSAAMLILLNNAFIEDLWAVLRRITIGLREQTNGKDMEQLSSEYVISEARRRRDSPVRRLLNEVHDQKCKRAEKQK